MDVLNHCVCFSKTNIEFMKVKKVESMTYESQETGNEMLTPGNLYKNLIENKRNSVKESTETKVLKSIYI